jgi:hypothetical protein
MHIASESLCHGIVGDPDFCKTASLWSLAYTLGPICSGHTRSASHVLPENAEMPLKAVEVRKAVKQGVGTDTWSTKGGRIATGCARFLWMRTQSSCACAAFMVSVRHGVSWRGELMPWHEVTRMQLIWELDALQTSFWTPWKQTKQCFDSVCPRRNADAQKRAC